MKKIVSVLLMSAAVFSAAGQKKAAVTDQKVLAAIKSATTYMIDKVGYNGGFVWDYLPDLSRQWGEMEAYRTMAWTQGAGTPAMGEFFLDLYHATGDEFYYQCAEKCAAALIWGQHPAGGWNYCFDFAGEASLRNWYNTIGRNGWRLEEFQHYYGNCTFDDDSTDSPARFLLRIYSEKWDPKFRASVEKTVNFMLESQYSIGGWPQRYPLMYEYSKNGASDYSSYITFNDGVHRNNFDLLLLYYRVLGDERLIDPMRRAMNCVIALQQGAPQPGWGDQFSLDYLPNHARSYEPRSMNTRQTAHCVENLLYFYQLTGETRFLARIPEALDWIESCRLPQADVDKYYSKGEVGDGWVCPMYIEIGTNRALYTHRRGSNVMNGKYELAYDLPGKLAHIKGPGLRAQYEQLKKSDPAKVTANSPLIGRPQPFSFPEYIKLRTKAKPTAADVEKLLADLVGGNYWLSPIAATSNPYIGPGDPNVVTPGKFLGVPVGDKYDTAPFPPDPAIMGITTKNYMENITQLVVYLKSK